MAGWVHRRRDHGGVVFIDLRDRSGLLQLVFHPEAGDAYEAAGSLSPEDVISVEGEVVARSEATINPALPTGRVELAVATLDMLSEADPLPFSVEDESQEASEELRLTYRYLDIRRPRRLRALEMRAKVAAAMRRVLDAEGFLEVETPVLTRSTPEGARDFLVPSRLQRGSWYALPQSPQLFKQLLMVGGLERYYQIVRCFRDEDLRADRQPEFTQLDIEASFVEPAEIQALMERVLQESFAAAGVDIPIPFPRMAYGEAVRRFGTDRPDVRFGMEIQDWTPQAAESGFGVFQGAVEAGGVVRGLVVPGAGPGVSRKVGDELMEEARELGAKGLVWAAVEEDGSLRSPVSRFLGSLAADFGAQPGDLIAMVADAEPVAQSVLGTLRIRFAERHGLVPGGRVGAAVGGRLPAGGVERGRVALGLHPPPVHGAAAGGRGPARVRPRVGAVARLRRGAERPGDRRGQHPYPRPRRAAAGVRDDRPAARRRRRRGSASCCGRCAWARRPTAASRSASTAS